jgi:hypothetical protein
MGVGQFIAEKHNLAYGGGPMKGHENGHAKLKERAIEELKEFWIISLYLFIFLGAFTLYRRMVLAEFGVTYLHYGAALIEALVIAKVVLIGRAVGLDKLGERRGPLIVPVVLKSGVFALLAILFAVLEYIVEGLIHKKDWASIASNLFGIGSLELFARMIMLFVSFIPFFAIWEIGQVLGRAELIELFFSRKSGSAPRMKVGNSAGSAEPLRALGNEACRKFWCQR